MVSSIQSVASSPAQVMSRPAQVATTAAELTSSGNAELVAIGQRLAAASTDLKSIVEFKKPF